MNVVNENDDGHVNDGDDDDDDDDDAVDENEVTDDKHRFYSALEK